MLVWNTPWNVNAALTWRYVGPVDVTFGNSNPQLNGVFGSADAQIGAQNYFDLALQWNATKNFTIRGGVNNIVRPRSARRIVHGQRRRWLTAGLRPVDGRQRQHVPGGLRHARTVSLPHRHREVLSRQERVFTLDGGLRPAVSFGGFRQGRNVPPRVRKSCERWRDDVECGSTPASLRAARSGDRCGA